MNPLSWALIVTCIVLIYIIIPRAFVSALNTYESISLAFFPSADRAYLYGERHFNGQNPQQYDVVRAEYFFREALKLDSSLKYVHHELARIYFLRGDFSAALMQIDVQIAEHGDATPNSYYVRGLIEGYMGDYASSAKDYEHFLKFDPHNWAGINDYAWVLLKAKRYDDAVKATGDALKYFPDNAWLLNSNAIALYESGQAAKARVQAAAALKAAMKITETQWLHAYPGNDPKIAAAGIASFQKAAADNVHRIDLALTGGAVQ